MYDVSIYTGFGWTGAPLIAWSSGDPARHLAQSPTPPLSPHPPNRGRDYLSIQFILHNNTQFGYFFFLHKTTATKY